MPVLLNKVAIVTGASSGIGRATALLFAQEGARVLVTARRQSALEELVAEIERAGGEAVYVSGDIRDESLAEKLVDTAVARFGGVDVAFNNAGASGEVDAAHQISSAGWNDTLHTNLTSAFLSAKYQIPAMIARGGGSLIFTSSFVGYSTGFPGMAAYAASKAGLVGMTQVIASEFGAQGVRANAILPGATDTAANAANLPGAAPQTRTFIEGLHALKRMATPLEIARSVLYLASDASSFVTGTAHLVDGGVSITRT